jgi:hypothetical protein
LSVVPPTYGYDASFRTNRPIYFFLKRAFTVLHGSHLRVINDKKCVLIGQLRMIDAAYLPTCRPFIQNKSGTLNMGRACKTLHRTIDSRIVGISGLRT